jgi:hypothetical protein
MLWRGLRLRGSGERRRAGGSGGDRDDLAARRDSVRGG